MDVVGSDPGGPVEVRHGSDEVVGEPEVDEHRDETVAEPPHPRHCPSVRGSVCPRVEGLIQRDRSQVRGPDGARGVHEETTSKTGETVTDEVGGQGDKDLVPKAASPRLVEVEWEVLHPDDVSGVRGRKSDVGHDGDNHVLLHVEPARVEAPRIAKSGELLFGEGSLK